MTCIVGVVSDDGAVHIGADSAGVAGLHLTPRKDSKVFVKGEFILGFSGSFRMGQLLRYSFIPPDIPEDKDLFDYMVVDFVNALRKTLKDGGWLTVRNEQEEAGFFLVGLRGRLFKIEDDFQVGESYQAYLACGCGDEFALGAISTLCSYLPDMPVEDKLLRALRVSSQFSVGVCAPYNICAVKDGKVLINKEGLL